MWPKIEEFWKYFLNKVEPIRGIKITQNREAFSIFTRVYPSPASQGLSSSPCGYPLTCGYPLSLVATPSHLWLPPLTCGYPLTLVVTTHLWLPLILVVTPHLWLPLTCGYPSLVVTPSHLWLPPHTCGYPSLVVTPSHL